MDYLHQKLTFKIKKVFRYIRLYGLRRTWIKVQGQKHLKRKFDTLPQSNTNFKRTQKIALIGCGNFAFTTIAYYLKKEFGDVIAAVMDIDINRAASLASYYKIPHYTDSFEEILNDDRIAMLYIATDHASHAEYAVQAMKMKKHVYIEKPHVVNKEQLDNLLSELSKQQSKVFLGFNRPVSPLGQRIREYLNKEDGSGMFNWFVIGHKLEPDHWYLQPGQGGRVLGNLCHWTDFILHLIPQNHIYPVEINPTRGEKEDSDIAVTLKFGEGSIAAITFSEKGYTFEGVRERFHAQKGDCILSLDDFQNLVVDVRDKKWKHHQIFRDQGHRRNVVSAYANVKNDEPYHFENRANHIYDTALLFLKTKDALESNGKLIINSR
ncbi:MAG TPA: Gfo/Idh/MocA family oxidoreductase [Caldithrix abyssi]|uniref:Gfo/Idh/MocA family oxidoreductase n=1 Tax=Caldithrix abyssi TaxID=187145 RepID=A0A7V4WWT1_CALAY|nr:Gfo/Idh/MocA family oxidoreductase [Caldithrix abyssi]